MRLLEILAGPGFCRHGDGGGAADSRSIDNSTACPIITHFMQASRQPRVFVDIICMLCRVFAQNEACGAMSLTAESLYSIVRHSEQKPHQVLQ
jgi:hypothetical protein